MVSTVPTDLIYEVFHADVWDVFSGGVVGFLSGVGVGFLIWGRPTTRGKKR